MKNFIRRIRANLKIILAKEVYFPIQKKIKKNFIGSKKYGGWFVDLKNLGSYQSFGTKIDKNLLKIN